MRRERHRSRVDRLSVLSRRRAVLSLLESRRAGGGVLARRRRRLRDAPPAGVAERPRREPQPELPGDYAFAGLEWNEVLGQSLETHFAELRRIRPGFRAGNLADFRDARQLRNLRPNFV